MAMSPPRRAMSPAPMSPGGMSPAAHGWSSPVFRRTMDALDHNSTRPNAMEALKKQVQTMEPDAVPRMLHHVGAGGVSSKHRKRFAVSLLEMCAKEHGHHITPLIPQLMATVVEHLAPAAGAPSDPSQPPSPTGSQASTHSTDGNGTSASSAGGATGLNERAGMGNGHGNGNGSGASGAGTSVFDFSGDAKDLHKACAQVAVAIVTYCPRTRTEEGLVLSEVCAALGNALVAPHSHIVQTGAAACLVSISSKMEGAKLPRHTQELLGKRLVECLSQPVRPVPALHLAYYFVRHNPNMAKSLGLPLLRISLDILVGPTDAQERLLAARVVQLVIPKCDEAAFAATEEGLSQALEGVKAEKEVHPMLRKAVHDALMALWMVKLNNNTRDQSFGLRSGTASPVDLLGGGGASPRYAGGQGHSRAFSFQPSLPSSPFIHSPGTASPTRAGPGVPGMLGLPFGVAGAEAGAGSFSPSQSQALYLTQLQLHAQAQAQAKAQSQSQCSSPVYQSPTRARPSPLAGTPPHFGSLLATPLSRGSSLISPLTPVARRNLPQDARTLQFPPLVSPIRTSSPHPEPRFPAPETAQGVEALMRSLSSPDATRDAAAGAATALAPSPLPVAAPAFASKADAGAEPAAAAECDLSGTESGAQSRGRAGAEGRSQRGGGSGGEGESESERGSGSASGGGGSWGETLSGRGQKGDPVAVNLSPALDAAAAEAEMAQELAPNGKPRADRAMEASSPAPAQTKPSSVTTFAGRQPLLTLATLNNSSTLNNGQSNSDSTGTGGSGSGANQLGVSPRSEQRERKTVPGTVESAAATPTRTPRAYQGATSVSSPAPPALGAPNRGTPGVPSGSVEAASGEAASDSEGGSGVGSAGSSSSQAGEPAAYRTGEGGTAGQGGVEAAQESARGARSVYGTPPDSDRAAAGEGYSDRTPGTVPGGSERGDAGMEALARAAAGVPLSGVPGDQEVGGNLRGLQGSGGKESGMVAKRGAPGSPGSTVTQEGEAGGDSEGGSSSSSGCTSKLRAEPLEGDASADVNQLSPAGGARRAGSPGAGDQFLEASEELREGEKEGGFLLELRLGPSPEQGKATPQQGQRQGRSQEKGTPPVPRARSAGGGSGGTPGRSATAQDTPSAQGTPSAQDTFDDASSTSLADLTLRLGPPEPPISGPLEGTGSLEGVGAPADSGGAPAGDSGEGGPVGGTGRKEGAPLATASKGVGVGRFHISPAGWNVGFKATPQLPTQSKGASSKASAAKAMSPRSLFQKLQSPLAAGEIDIDDADAEEAKGQLKGQGVRGKPTDGGSKAQESAKESGGGVTGDDEGVGSGEEGVKGEGEGEGEADEEGVDGVVYLDDTMWSWLRVFKRVQEWERMESFKAGAEVLSRAATVTNKVIEAAMFGVLAVSVSVLVSGLLQSAHQDSGFLPS